jgi:hypothetical protein
MQEWRYGMAKADDGKACCPSICFSCFVIHHLSQSCLSYSLAQLPYPAFCCWRLPSSPSPAIVCTTLVSSFCFIPTRSKITTAAMSSEERIMAIPGAKGSIDPLTFGQILEMDDYEDECDFNKSIVYDFFSQADNTFDKMETSL